MGAACDGRCWSSGDDWGTYRVPLFKIIARALVLPGKLPALKAVLTWPTFSLTSYEMVTNLARQGVRPHSVLDVGANVGQFAVAAAKTFKGVEVHSFEPQPDCVDSLKKHVRTLDNVNVYACALGDKEGMATLHVNSHRHSSSILPLGVHHKKAFPDAQEVSVIEVPVLTLDQKMADVSLPSPVLLKLDVQGYETRVLQGAAVTLRQVDYVVLEASFKPLYEGERLFVDIMNLMDELGFRFARPVGWLSDDRTGEILQIDALFERRGR